MSASISSPSYSELTEVDKLLSQMRLEYWLHTDLFSIQWWFLIFLLIAPWFVFLKLVNKNRKTEILLFGTLIIILVITLDDLGLELQLWSYKHRVSIINKMNPVNYSVLPITYMLIYQHFITWKSFIIVIVCFSIIGAFIVEPFFVWLDIYKLNKWEHYYSLPFYILIPILFRWLLTSLKNPSS
jgi:hypothetical protein